LGTEDLMAQSDVRSLKDSSRNRKKSLGVMSTTSASVDDSQDKKHYRSGSDKARNVGDFICKKLFEDSYSGKKDQQCQKMTEAKKRKSSNTSSDMLSISGSSVTSDHYAFHNQNKEALGSQNEIRAETLAEIEVGLQCDLCVQCDFYGFIIHFQCRHSKNY